MVEVAAQNDEAHSRVINIGDEVVTQIGKDCPLRLVSGEKGDHRCRSREY